MREVAFETLFWICIYLIPVVLACLLLCVPWGGSDDSQVSSGDERYMAYRARTGQDGKWQGLHTDSLDGPQMDAEQDVGTDAAREGDR